MKTGRPAIRIELSDENKLNYFVAPSSVKSLPNPVFGPKSSWPVQGAGTSIAKRLDIGVHTVSHWRVRLAGCGLMV